MESRGLVAENSSDENSEKDGTGLEHEDNSSGSNSWDVEDLVPSDGEINVNELEQSYDANYRRFENGSPIREAKKALGSVISSS